MIAMINKDNCTGCGACVDICPVGAISIESGKAVVGKKCVGCGVCISNCSAQAITIS